MHYLPDEQMYRHLAEFLRAGGTLEVGEDVSLGSFARLRIGNTTVNVMKMAYRDFSDVLGEMDSLARNHLRERGKRGKQ